MAREHNPAGRGEPDPEREDDPGQPQRPSIDPDLEAELRPEFFPQENPQELLGPLEEEDEEEFEVDEEEEDRESVTVEISGLSLYTHHGLSNAEQEVGQRLVFDLRLDLGRCAATATDSIEDTIDYAEVCQLVALVAQQRSHRTLERLCARIAERLLDDYDLEGVWVKATKPEPPIALTVEGVSVELWRESS